MSSFGSSLLNKSSKKIIPRAGGRRRQITVQPPSGSNSLPSPVKPSVEPISADQDSTAANAISNLDLIVDAEIPHGQQEPLLGVLGETAIDALRPAPANSTVHVSPTASSVELLAGTAYAREEPYIHADSTAASQSSHVSPLLEDSPPPKRPRIDLQPASGQKFLNSRDLRNVSVKSGTSAPSVTVDKDGIPIIQISRPPITMSRGAGNPHASASINTKGRDAEPRNSDLVFYEIPEVTETRHPPKYNSADELSSSRIPPSLSNTTFGQRPRAKGSRRSQWQVTTQADLAPRSPKQQSDILDSSFRHEGTEEDPIAVVGPKARKTRKDKGQRKVPKPDQFIHGVNLNIYAKRSIGSAEDSHYGEAVSSPRPLTHLTSRISDSAEISTEGSKAIEPDVSSLLSSESSSRIRNLQRRKAKKTAAQSAISRQSGAQLAKAIDHVVEQNFGDHGLCGSSLLSPLPLKTSQRRTQIEEITRNRRSSTAATDISTITETNASSTLRRKYQRPRTPEGNEEVFIAEKATQMVNLVGRDTENRFGMKSGRERAMRTIDWQVVKEQRKLKERNEAMARGSKKIEETTSQPERESEDASDRDGNTEREDDDVDELERLVEAREAEYGRAGVDIRAVNGQHVAVEDTMEVDPNARIDDEMENEAKEEDDDLTKTFNVHTYVTWKRKDPLERVYQSKRWSDVETERFYDALRCCGVDFGSMLEWFPGRIRRALKRKFNTEERAHPERVNETLKAHLMSKQAHADNEDGEVSWDIQQFQQAWQDSRKYLVDPKEIERELNELGGRMTEEVEAVRAEYLRERGEREKAGARTGDSEDEEGNEDGEKGEDKEDGEEEEEEEKEEEEEEEGEGEEAEAEEKTTGHGNAILIEDWVATARRGASEKLEARKMEAASDDADVFEMGNELVESIESLPA